MIKVYLIKYKEFNETEFSKYMSSKYKNNHQHDISSYAYYKLETILLNEFNYKIDIDKICYNECSKPFIKDNNLYFNISHSNDYILIAISDLNVGVDIESKIQLKRANSIIEKFNKEEIEKYNKVINKEEYITKLWVKKESLAKLNGTGLSFSLLASKINNKQFNVKKLYSKQEKRTYYISIINQNYERIGEINYDL